MALRDEGEQPPVAFRIGGAIPVRWRVLAAPMCGGSKLPYRRQARRFGADLVYTEMVKAKPLARGDPKTLKLLETAADEAPCGPQICGAELDTMAEAARRLEQLGFPLVDLNMGCPVRKVVREGAGAALLRDPARVEAVVRAVRAAVTVPVTVKLRSGWDQERDEGQAAAPALARACEAGGADLITIHGRARSQRHSGGVDVEALAQAKQAVAIPVVANGGVDSAEGAARLLNETGCDAVMIGRGAQGRPWLFRDVGRRLAGLPPLPAPGPDEACDLMLDHLEGMLEIMGERGAVAFRKYASWYFRELPGAHEQRDRVHRAPSAAAIREAIADWRERWRRAADTLVAVE